MNNNNINVVVDANGHVANFAIVGDLIDSVQVQIDDFNEINFDCYKLVDSKLIWDEEKYQEKINPVLIEPEPSEIDILRDYILDMELRMIMKELEV